MSDKHCCVVGLGYIGLPCAIMLANAGCKVTGVDINEDLVRRINIGSVSVEDDLENILRAPSVLSNLTATTEIVTADVFIVAVPTPIHPQRKCAELSSLISAVEAVLSVLKIGDLVIIESTLPPLTTRNVIQPILQQSGLRAGEDFFLAYCPERLMPGNIVYEIVHNNRVVGGVNYESSKRAAGVYSLFVKGSISVTDDVTAELCKLVENTYRDVNIALANEISDVCSYIGVDAGEVIDLANLHPRVSMLKPGIGVGGHCLPVDPWFIHEVLPYHSTMIAAARRINGSRPAEIAAKIRGYVASDMTQDFLILGKTYKPEATDTRESPAIEIIKNLQADGYRVHAYDPYVDVSSSLEAMAVNARYIFVLVPHKRLLGELNALLEKYEKTGNKKPDVICF